MRQSARMSGRTATWIGVAVTVVTAVNFAVFVGAGLSSGLASGVTAFVAIMAYSIVGTLVVGRQPGNALAWIFCAAPFFIALSGAGEAYYEHAHASWPAATVFGMISDTGWIVGLGVPACFLGLLIPDGHLPSRRWRPVAWVAVFGIACAVAGTVFGESRVDDHGRNPVRIAGAQYLFTGAAIAVLVLLGAGIVAVVVRYRRGTPIERQQLKWIIAAFVVMIAFGLVGGTIPEQLWFASWALLPIAFAVAIFRYRLYEIDVIIRKTIVYATLVGALAVIYLAGIALIERGLQTVSGQSSALAVTLSTLAVAAAFQPLRRRIQRAVDHRFYRRKYDSSRMLDTFTARLRDQVDLENLQTETLRAVQATVQPRHASIWLRHRDDDGTAVGG